MKTLIQITMEIDMKHWSSENNSLKGLDLAKEMMSGTADWPDEVRIDAVCTNDRVTEPNYRPIG